MFDDSDCESEEDEPPIVVSFVPTNHAGSQDKEASHMDDCSYAEDLARLQRQEQEAKDEAERMGLEFSRAAETLIRDAAENISRNDDSADAVPNPADAFNKPSTNMDEPFSRFPSPSDLGNNQPSDGIFQTSKY